MENLSKPFKIACAIENAACYERFEKGQRRQFIVGRASGTMVDRDHERVAESALLSIQKAIEDGLLHEDGTVTPIPLMSEHQQGWDDHLGILTKAWIDDQWDLWIEAELDPDNPRSHYLYTKLTKAGPNQKQYGLSIGGIVLEAGYEWNEDLQKTIRVFHNVGLHEVSVTSRPAYPTAYLNALSKSVAWDGVHTARQLVVTEEIMKSYKGDVTTDAQPHEAVEKNETETVVEQAEAVAKAETEAADETVVEKAEADEAAAEEAVEKAADEATEAEEAVEKAAGEAEDAETVEKAEAYVSFSASAYGDAREDPIAVLQEAIAALTEKVNAIEGVLKSVSEAPAEDAVEKSDAAETEAEAVEKTANEDQSAEVVAKSGAAVSEDVIAKALTDALGQALDEKLAPVAKALGNLEQRLSELESQEVDGSISVSKAIGNQPEDDPRQQLEKKLAELPTPGDRIAYLLQLQSLS